MINGLSFNVNVKVSSILDALNKHLEEHKTEYAEAVVEFNKSLAEKATSTLDRITKNDFSDVQFNFGFIRPVNCVDQYNEMINAFSSVSDEEIEMNITQLGQIMNNNWNWLSVANTINSTYSSSLRSKLG